MEKKGKSLKQEGLRNQWGSPEVVKKDFLLIPIYIVFQNLMPIIIVFGVLGVHAMITQDPPPLYVERQFRYSAIYCYRVIFCIT